MRGWSSRDFATALGHNDHIGEICDASLACHEDSDIISMLSPDYFGIRGALPRQSIF